MALRLGKSPQLHGLGQRIERFARSDAPILLVGETGTGKDHVARCIHEASGATGNFVVVDARGSESMLHAQLRGYVEGAFTGCRGAQAGALERARGGSVYIDGVDALSQDAQRILLGVLSRASLRRIGASKRRPIKARIIASSQRDLGPLIRAGQFRFDLYQRLGVLTLQLPSLRSRPLDVLALLKHFLGSRKISRSAFQALIRCPWRGNVRELQQVLEVSKVMQREETLKGSTVRALLSGREPWVRDSKESYRALKQRACKEELQFLQGILTQHRGCLSQAARSLGLSRQQLSRRLRKLKPAVNRPSQG